MLAAQSLIVIPLALHALGSRFLGAWLASGDVLAWMLALDLGLPHLIAQRVGSANGAHDSRRVHEVFAAGTAILLLLAALTLVGAMAAAPLVARVLGVTGPEATTLATCFAIAGLATALMIISNSVVGYARGMQNTALVNAFMLLGTIGGAVVTIGGLVSGMGLWSFPAGLLTRASVTLIGCVALLILEVRRRALVLVTPPADVFREFTKLVPVAGVGGICYQMMTQTESLLIGVLLRPDLVPVYVVTRRGADVLRALIDGIALSTYAGFAHLVASADRARSLAVHARITNFRLILSVSAAAAYLAVNGSFVAIWAGPAMFGGHLLTLLIALQMIAAGGSFLMNYLYRAAGAIWEASMWQIGEAAIRVPLATLTVLAAGFTLVPLPGILVAGVAGYLLLRKTRKLLADHASPVPLLTFRMVIALVAVVASGGILGLTWAPASWPYVIGAGGSIALLSALCLFRLDPHPLIPRLAFR